MPLIKSFISKPLNNEFYHNLPSMVARMSYFYPKTVGDFSAGRTHFVKRDDNALKGYLLMYVTEGRGFTLYRGRKYKIKKGQVIFINTYEKHTYFSDRKSPWSLKWILFDGNACEGFFKTIYDYHGAVIDMDKIPVYQHIDDILDLFRTRDLQLEIKASLSITKLLTDIILSFSAGISSDNENTCDKYINASISFIEDNYQFNITVDDLAQAACCSKYYFARLFKRITGYSPIEYIINFRLNKAKELLKVSDMSVKEISEKVGFKDKSYFIETFKRHEHTTPLKYRKSWCF